MLTKILLISKVVQFKVSKPFIPFNTDYNKFYVLKKLTSNILEKIDLQYFSKHTRSYGNTVS